ncbi:hypothetical protein BWI15_12195 [Kribbella sp. ALI-6-A]|uniref:hypothetical protein n=1 Tax=Kribbella sp. ALI-6-A TaxID=1933817 RepID=UPI0009CD3528|nr:hypothetical protein [Kribbella sp. ALI-6-A]ONI74122.1 hypothetical protein BWI15_12195 [Kribbella sp. ALI-6-A]
MDEGIALKQTAVRLRLPDDDVLPRALLSLGESHLMRFEDRGDPDDIAQAITHLEAALTQFDGHGSHRAAFLTSLGQAMWTRYERGIGAVDDLNESVRLLETAVALTPADNPSYGSRLSNLASALWTRFEISRHPGDLDAAIDHDKAALDALPLGHTDRVRVLLNLGLAYQAQFDQTGEPDHGRRAIATWKVAASLPTTWAGMRIGTARNAADLASRMGDTTTALACYEFAIRLLPEVAWHGLTTTGRDRILKNWSGLAAQAAGAALAAERADIALEMLESGRSVSWDQILGFRVRLDTLRRARPDLADRLAKTGASIALANRALANREAV